MLKAAAIAIPDLQGQRVRVSLAKEQEAKAMLEFQLRNADHLLPWYPPVPKNFFEISYWIAWAKAAKIYQENGKALMCNIRLKADMVDRVIGQINLTNIQRGALQMGVLGYHIDHGVEGKGLMREALGLLVEFSFKELRLNRVSANYVVGNARSANLLKRLGFVEEGVAEKYLYVSGEWRDHVLTSKLNDRAVLPHEPGIVLDPKEAMALAKAAPKPK